MDKTVVKIILAFYLVKNENKEFNNDCNKNRILFSWCFSKRFNYLNLSFLLNKKYAIKFSFGYFLLLYYWQNLGRKHSISICTSKPSNKLKIILVFINLYVFYNFFNFLFTFYLTFMLTFKKYNKTIFSYKQLSL